MNLKDYYFGKVGKRFGWVGVGVERVELSDADRLYAFFLSCECG